MDSAWLALMSRQAQIIKKTARTQSDQEGPQPPALKARYQHIAGVFYHPMFLPASSTTMLTLIQSIQLVGTSSFGQTSRTFRSSASTLSPMVACEFASPVIPQTCGVRLGNISSDAVAVEERSSISVFLTSTAWAFFISMPMTLVVVLISSISTSVTSTFVILKSPIPRVSPPR